VDRLRFQHAEMRQLVVHRVSQSVVGSGDGFGWCEREISVIVGSGP
jgi:hypothetical protein